MSDEIHLPSALQGIFFSFRWDKQALWRLPTAPQSIPFAELTWHLDLPIWSTHPPAPLFDLRPRAVIAHPHEHRDHWERIQAADTTFPIELFQHNGRWVIMDGYHRLAKLFVEDTNEILVRMHPDELLPLVKR